jgi:hypothetical protein
MKATIRRQRRQHANCPSLGKQHVKRRCTADAGPPAQPPKPSDRLSHCTADAVPPLHPPEPSDRLDASSLNTGSTATWRLCRASASWQKVLEHSTEEHSTAEHSTNPRMRRTAPPEATGPPGSQEIAWRLSSEAHSTAPRRLLPPSEDAASRRSPSRQPQPVPNRRSTASCQAVARLSGDWRAAELAVSSAESLSSCCDSDALSRSEQVCMQAMHAAVSCAGSEHHVPPRRT